MIVIEPPPSAQAREIRLEDGSLRASLLKSEEDYEFTIRTKGGTLRAKSPSTKESNSLQTSLKEGKLSVAVESGQVEVETESGNYSLKNSEKISLSEGQPAAVESFSPQIDVLTPPDPAELSLAPYVFEVTPILNASKYRWIFASGKDQVTSLLEQTTDTPSLTLQYLDPGSIYWRVEAEVDGLIYTSNVRRLDVK